MTAPLLEARELSASYGRVAALKPVSLTVAEGELVTVLGPNGAGKTTLLRAMTRLISAQGKLLFKGEDVSALATHELAARGIIMVQEGPLALKLAKRAYVISLGRIAAELAAGEIKSHHDLAKYYLH